MALTSYRNKRNFKSTPEPQGDDKAVSKPGALRFVVQMHDATRKHYDVRLELDGTMLSWAVPKGPSLDPMERRLAVRVEDHPIEYNEFEGIIPPGNYGAGSVMIWDEGTYTARAIEFPAKDEADALRRGLAKGHLTVLMHGTKLKGEFALIRLAKGDGDNWLMVKKHDKHISRAEITNADRSVRSGRTLGEIAAMSRQEGKVWISGKGLAAANWEAPGKARAEAPKATPSKARSAAAPKSKSAAKSQRKVAASREPLPPKLRKLGVAEAPPGVAKSAPWLPAATAPGAAGRIFQPLYDGYRAQLILGEDGQAKLFAKTGVTLTKRFPDLVAALGELSGPLRMDGLVVAIDAAGAPRRRGRRAAEDETRYAFFAYDLTHADGVDLSALPLESRLAALGQLNIVSDVLRIVDRQADAAASDDAAIGGVARLAKEAYGVTKAAVTYRAGAISQRGESAPSEAVALVPAAEARLPGSRHEVIARSSSASEARLTLSNLTKIYWPKERITKGDMIAYYRAVAPVMVPHLRGRPQSLNRHPNGIEAASFFQKEVAGHLPGWFQTATIASGRSGKTVTYALCQTETDLLYLANMGCIEINTWLSRVPQVNQPDFVVFDLDPGQIAFESVIETARAVKSVLDELELPAYCKTSGGRGLHVYLPVKDATSFDEARNFAETLSREVHRLLPATTSLERSPAKRTRLIYLDYLQNRIGQTMASIYSVRPRPGAGVSTPLKWTEVKRGLDPAAFTMVTVPKRLAKLGDLWEGIAADAVSLPAAQAALDELITARKNKLLKR